jgi:hypothetical protein
MASAAAGGLRHSGQARDTRCSRIAWGNFSTTPPIDAVARRPRARTRRSSAISTRAQNPRLGDDWLRFTFRFHGARETARGWL